MYEGQFSDDLKHGEGKYIWYDGRIYEGEWKMNQMNGNGIYKWPDG